MAPRRQMDGGSGDDAGDDPTRRTRVQSAQRAIRLLMTVVADTTDNSGTALAAAVGLPQPTAHHLLATLVDEGLLMRTENRRYALGPQVARIADAFYRDGAAPEAFLGPLRQLAATTGETAYLAMWHGSEVQLLASVEGQQSLRVSAPSRPYHDAHARATGKLLLAYATPEARSSYLSAHALRPLTPRTITDPQLFERELELIRDRGYAIEHEEFVAGISCISVPVLDPDGQRVVVAFSLSVPSSRFHEHEHTLTTAALHVAAGVGRSLFGVADRRLGSDRSARRGREAS